MTLKGDVYVSENYEYLMEQDISQGRLSLKQRLMTSKYIGQALASI